MLTFEDRWSMCRPSKIDGRCVDFEIVDLVGINISDLK